MINNIQISIIMPVYNAEKYIQKAVDSVLNQTFDKFELILVDDGSNDNSGRICDRYMKLDKRVKVIHKENGGICTARNVGLDTASGKYVTFIDNDDVINENTFKDNYELAEIHNADWVKFGKTEIMIQGDKILKVQDSSFEEGVFEKEDVLKNILKFRCRSMLTFVWDSLFSREIIEAGKLRFDTAFKYGNEDVDFSERYAFLCKKMVVNSKCYYKHYTRLGFSTSSKYSHEAIDLHLYLQGKSNARYETIDGLNIRKNPDYFLCITRSQVVPICQKLNDAGRLLGRREKVNVLSHVWNNKSLYIYVSKKINLKRESRKMAIYNELFVNKWFTLLLLIDKYSRKFVYFIRSIGARYYGVL